MGNDKEVVFDKKKKRFRAFFDTTDEGKMIYYLGCMVERNYGQLDSKIRRLVCIPSKPSFNNTREIV